MPEARAYRLQGQEVDTRIFVHFKAELLWVILWNMLRRYEDHKSIDDIITFSPDPKRFRLNLPNVFALWISWLREHDYLLPKKEVNNY